jgi:hypothetical protein
MFTLLNWVVWQTYRAFGLVWCEHGAPRRMTPETSESRVTASA